MLPWGLGDFELVTSKGHWLDKLTSAQIHFYKASSKLFSRGFRMHYVKDNLRTLLFTESVSKAAAVFTLSGMAFPPGTQKQTHTQVQM